MHIFQLYCFFFFFRQMIFFSSPTVLSFSLNFLYSSYLLVFLAFVLSFHKSLPLKMLTSISCYQQYFLYFFFLPVFFFSFSLSLIFSLFFFSLFLKFSPFFLMFPLFFFYLPPPAFLFFPLIF